MGYAPNYERIGDSSEVSGEFYEGFGVKYEVFGEAETSSVDNADA